MPLDPPDDEALAPLGDIVDSIGDAFDAKVYEAAQQLVGARLRQLPHDTDAERQLLGGCLVDGRCIDRAREEGLEPAHFFRPAHGLIFAAALAIHPGQPVDPGSVAAELHRRGSLEDVGGRQVLDGLIGWIEKTWRAEELAAGQARRIVKQAVRRQLVEVHKTSIAAILTGRDDPAALIEDSKAQLERTAPAIQGKGFAAEVRRARRDLQMQGHGTERIAGDEPLFKPIGDLLDANIPRTQWLVRGIMTESGVGAISGEPKTAKTWAALEMMCALACGDEAFGQFPTGTPKVVAGLFVEDGPGSVKNRLKSIIHGARRDERSVRERMHYRCLKSIDLRDIDDLAVLVASAREVGPLSLMVVDPLRDLIGGADENSNSEMSQVMHALRSARNLLGCSFAFVHHAAKASKDVSARRAGQRMRGASAVHGAIDFGLHLYDLKGDAKQLWQNTAHAEVKGARAAGVFGLELAVSDDHDGAAVAAGWTYHEDPKQMGSAQEEAERDTARAAILRQMRLGVAVAKRSGRPEPTFSAVELSRLTRIPDRTIRRHLDAMTEHVGRAGRGYILIEAEAPDPEK